MTSEEFHEFREVVASMHRDDSGIREDMLDKIGREMSAELASSVARLAKTTDEGLRCLETCEGGGRGGISKAQGRRTEYLLSPLS